MSSIGVSVRRGLAVYFLPNQVKTRKPEYSQLPLCGHLAIVYFCIYIARGSPTKAIINCIAIAIVLLSLQRTAFYFKCHMKVNWCEAHWRKVLVTQTLTMGIKLE